MTKRTRTHEEIFCNNSKVSRHVVKRRILTDKLIAYKCNECPLTDEWNEKPLKLHLEHKNGKRNDHRIENLCFLCPNCHSQTPTYCGRNKTRVVKRSREKYNAEHRLILIAKHQPDVDKVLRSDIDFTKYGWSAQVARLLGKNPQKVKYWMTRYMSDLYKRCFHRTTQV